MQLLRILAKTTLVRSRGLLVLGIACGAHAGALLALYAMMPFSLVVDAAPPTTAEIELEASEQQETPPTASLVPGRAVETPQPPGNRAAFGLHAAMAEESPTAAKDLTSPVGETAPLVGGAPEWSFSPSAVTIDLTAAITPDLVAPPRERPADTEPQPVPVSTTGGLAEGLAAHDVEVGTGRGGAMLSAAEAAARDGNAPPEGGVTFQVTVGDNGAVDARILSADPDPSVWAAVTESLVRSVDPRRIRIPPGAHGWRVVVRVDAKMRLADGREVRSLRGLHGSVKPSVLQEAIEGKTDARGASTAPGGPDHVDETKTEPPPVGGAVGSRGPSNAGAATLQGLARRIVPTPTLSVDGKVWSPSLQVTPVGATLGGPFTPENIGQGARRIVSGRIVSEGSI